MKYITITILFIALVMTHAMPAGHAASLELTASSKIALDKIIAEAQAPLSKKIKLLHGDLRYLQGQDQQWDIKIRLIHYNNEEAQLLLRRKVADIDADKLKKLDLERSQSKQRHKPLFTAYTALNQQIAAVRTLKNTHLNSTLKTQANLMKMSVQLARSEIKRKEDQLSAAKKNTAQTIKRIRGILAEIDPIKVRIKAERSAAGDSKKHVGYVWTNLNQAIKKGDAAGTESNLASLVHFSRVLVEQKKRIHNLEQGIEDILIRVKSQIPEPSSMKSS